MTDPLYTPESLIQLADCVRQAAADKQALEIIGGASKRRLGHVADGLVGLSTGKLTGIETYEPEELILTVGAGTPLTDIAAALAVHGQALAFEPPDYGPLFGVAAGAATIGGVLSCNAAGPRRIRAGAARDHILGVSAVNGAGVSYKAGGRVVKNVTGFDLCKLLTGAFGTLGVLGQVTVKVLPVAPGARTVQLLGLDAAAALALFVELLAQPREVTGACHLPAALAGDGVSVTALRLEGPEASLDARVTDLTDALARRGEIRVLDSGESRPFWKGIGDVQPFADETESALWRLFLPPARTAAALAQLANIPGTEALIDWGGGLVWLRAPDSVDAYAQSVRAAAKEAGGHATLFRAADGVKARVPVFPPLSDGEKALNARIKAAFDPDGLFNPGRMGPGRMGGPKDGSN